MIVRADLVAANWATLTPSEMRAKWPLPLNQVGCTGTYLLSHCGRVINEQPQCVNSFVFHADSDRSGGSLNEAIVYYSASAYDDVREAADLFGSAWRPRSGTVVSEFGQKEWERSRRLQGRLRAVTHWEIKNGSCLAAMKLEREVYPNGAVWTAKVALSFGPIVCDQGNAAGR